jgi:predicted DCC family thiol-disulfide oxidoreductase YuxK
MFAGSEEFMIKNIWHRLFLEERPSISLSFFRLAVALTTGAVVLPTLCHLADNYFLSAFKSLNANFFPLEFLEFVQKSPDWVVVMFVWLFCIFWFFFLIGLWSQTSCIIMTLACYYFYALNAFHVGTLSWDILLVTLFLICITPYHGDYFSVDCLVRGHANAYKRKRPYFVQRLLQLQIGFTFFYTALYKVSAKGNWLTDNPIYYIMNYPPEGTAKLFLLRDFLYDKPELCYAIGIFIVIMEFLMIVLLFYPRTRISAIYLGVAFHIMLLLTLDVPATFFFLFPPQLLLFIHPGHVIRWIEQKRSYNQSTGASLLIYDGNCHFCLASLEKLKIMDLFGTLKLIDLHRHELKSIHQELTKERAISQLHLIEPDGRLYGGFAVFRRICFTMPMLYPLIPIFYFPGMGLIGPPIYRLIAKNRYLFHFNPTCKNNACFR